LTVTEDVEVVGGRLEVGAGGRLTVGDEMIVEDAEYVSLLDGADAGLIAVAEGLELYEGSTLSLQAAGSLDAVGPALLALVETGIDGQIEGVFDNQPSPGDHLGYGVFHRDVAYAEDGIAAELFQAAPGDANGDGYFTFEDLISIFSLGGPLYGDGDNDNCDWFSGDFNGDHDFDFADLVLAFSTLGPHYGDSEPYPIDTLGGQVYSSVTPVPEPSTLALLSLAPVAVFCARRFRQRKR